MERLIAEQEALAKDIHVSGSINAFLRLETAPTGRHVATERFKKT
jgi:hypothetical protein